MSQENSTFTFFSTSVAHFSPQIAHAQRAALPQRPPALCVFSSHSTLTTEVTRVWPLHLVVTKPAQDVDLSPSPAALNSFMKLLWDQIFLETDWTGEDICPSRCCSCGWHLKQCGSTSTDGLDGLQPPLPAGVAPGCLAPRLHPMQGPNMSIGHKENEQREHHVKSFCAFSCISFLTYFFFPGSSDHMYRIPTTGEQFSIFFSSSST